MRSPYRSDETEARKLEPDLAPGQRVRRAAAATALIGASIGATAPVLGLGVAALGGGVALLGLLLLRDATNETKKAPCPTCGSPIHAIDPTIEAVPCPSCGEYARVTDGGLIALRDEFVAQTPLFAIPFAVRAPVLAPVCAECGAPGAERLVLIKASSALGTALIQVPHCNHHANGADVSSAALRVRSHALWLSTRASKQVS